MKLQFVQDQVDGAVVELVNNIREEDLKRAITAIRGATQHSLSLQDMRFAQALAQVDHVQQLVDNPNMLLGRMDTKHGELAEQVEVAIQNSKSLLHGMGIIATADPEVVGRTRNAPTDYIINGIHVQSKFINSESNTLTHVLEHLEKYEKIGFGRDDRSFYHIPKDQYKNIITMLKKGEFEGRKLSSIEAIRAKVSEIERISGRKFEDVVRPAHVKYGEVQWGRIDGTLEKIRFNIEEENEQLIKKIEADSKKEQMDTPFLV